MDDSPHAWYGLLVLEEQHEPCFQRNAIVYCDLSGSSLRRAVQGLPFVLHPSKRSQGLSSLPGGICQKPVKEHTSHHLEQGITDMARSRQTENPCKEEAREGDTWRIKGFEMLLFILGTLKGHMHTQE